MDFERITENEPTKDSIVVRYAFHEAEVILAAARYRYETRYEAGDTEAMLDTVLLHRQEDVMLQKGLQMGLAQFALFADMVRTFIEDAEYTPFLLSPEIFEGIRTELVQEVVVQDFITDIEMYNQPKDA